jgi:hypothetical protein
VEERSVHVEWPITGKLNENEKKGTKSTARHAKNSSLLFEEQKKGGVHVSNRSGWVLFRYKTGVRSIEKGEENTNAWRRCSTS